ncbi:MAG: hypothetical protein PHP34_07420 [Bacteroidales bacterium]|nr:hypothetical protein [Bacteroidales bacterium]
MKKTRQVGSFSKRGPRTLLLKWGDFAGAEDVNIHAGITLDSKKALSYWKIAIGIIQVETSLSPEGLLIVEITP